MKVDNMGNAAMTTTPTKSAAMYGQIATMTSSGFSEPLIKATTFSEAFIPLLKNDSGIS